ncbi:MAG: hypothetical protein A2836_03985 [Candidatus Taylorbacteria bacterium RIFCSPHIGHO2_01_FULL_45_63]|uniref:Transposase IS200-like domain-containing protein n=1 Tax=Candidatus Taylorbacteria bacterium RIFCSPHIGHO2_02_FULL_45_35 TaxID=1802311 RepID=A0A1G2MQE4_9BACT|nr:MAG: hypothetical protein A2836_03985 [Candidatus Taylorbacteria bacterium RIFCSPHIGHO2_01_FULL_45_63]OHA26120.1 MAG: hypothetical protein A3D56_01725 [Candidatus Taylorbacteria bacterium RIFCSPHIGHO2_02_FULL_45_35]OHA32531.1 MAG: hypothetical protein A3A22_03285 [Candidatus Taylorbacteria bacterium RIFCSPLOWO2_01_FULL_45_34b]
MTRNIEISIDGYYHVYNRGTDKRKIFNADRDYKRFIGLLYMCNSTNPVHITNSDWSLNSMLGQDREKTIIDIGTYCCMPNHFHLLVREKMEGGISKFMQKLSTAYTMYFNTKEERTGALFQGKFKAEYADNDEYMKYLFSYIHLNPIKLIESTWKETGIVNKKKALSFLKNYSYSSYQDFLLVDRPEKVILERKAFPGYFETVADFETTIRDWLHYNEKRGRTL